MTAASARKTDEFRRYRERKKAQGLREIRMWVPDVHIGVTSDAWRDAVNHIHQMQTGSIAGMRM